MPRKFHHALIHALCGIEVVEQCAVADGFRVDVIRVEHLVADDTLYAVGRGIAGVQRLLGVGHACLLIDLVLTVAVLVSGAVLPAEGGLHVRRREGIDGSLIVAHIDTELVAKAGGIAVGCPGEDDTVGLTLHLDVVHRHRTHGAHRHCGLRVVAGRVLVPKL